MASLTDQHPIEVGHLDIGKKNDADVQGLYVQRFCSSLLTWYGLIARAILPVTNAMTGKDCSSRCLQLPLSAAHGRTAQGDQLLVQQEQIALQPHLDPVPLLHKLACRIAKTRSLCLCTVRVEAM